VSENTVQPGVGNPVFGEEEAPYAVDDAWRPTAWINRCPRPLQPDRADLGDEDGHVKGNWDLWRTPSVA